MAHQPSVPRPSPGSARVLLSVPFSSPRLHSASCGCLITCISFHEILDCQVNIIYPMHVL